MAFLVAAVGGLAFGGVDQYLGTVRFLALFGSWPSVVSGMSAPWLLLPFLVGCTQREPRRAMLLGLVATLAALLGYFALTLSPLEGVAVSRFPTAFVALVREDRLWVVGGLIFGPLYGLLGQRWRVGRSRIGIGLVAGAFCLEPFVRQALGRLGTAGPVWVAEVAAGAALAVTLVVLSRRRRDPPQAPSAG